MYKWTCIMIVSMSFVLAGCSSDDDPAVSQVTASLTTVNGKLKAVSDMVGGVSSSSVASAPVPLMNNQITPFATGIAGVWTTNPGVIPLSNSGTSSLKQWIIDEFDENFVNSNGAKVTFAGRMSNALSMFCFLGLSGIPVDTTNLPIPGTYNFTLTALMLNACGESSTELAGTTITLTSSSPADTSVYDRKINITFPGQESCPFKIQARINAQFINIAETEDQSCDGRDHASLAVFTHDKTTLVSKFYYISKAFSGYPSGFEVYRGYLNEVTDEAYVIGFYGGDDNGDTTFPNGISFVTVGKPVAGGTFALSVQSINNTIADNVYQGCIDSSLNVASDNTLNCSLTGYDATNTHANVVQDLYDDYNSRADIFNMSETASVGFNDHTDIDD